MSNAKYGIIAAGHEETAKAGEKILEAGGNAFDAAIGAMLAACVCESSSISLAGGGFLLAHTHQHENILYDFFTQTPSKKRSLKDINFYPVTINFEDNTQDFHIGLGSMAVPGNIAGMFEVHRQLGKMPFTELATPAIELAQKGTALDSFQWWVAKLLLPIVQAAPEGQAIFLNDKGALKNIGDWVKMPYLADTLYVLAKEGPREFYEGEIAQRLLRDCQTKGGFISGEDLKNYQVIARSPLSMQYRNRTLLTNPPPSSGGSLIAFSLALLQSISLEKIKIGSKKHIELLIDAMRFTNVARKKDFDSRVYDASVLQDFFAPNYVNQYANSIKRKFGSTTQISTMDVQGNAASITISSGEGAGYFIPETGIMMNNMLGEEDLNPKGFHQWTPNQRISSMMSPTMILKDGQPQIVLGSGGSNRIRTAVLQVISNVIDFNMPIEEAVRFPRIHAENGQVNVEAGFDESSIAKLSIPDDWRKIIWQQKNMYFGGVHSVMLEDNGYLRGAGDARRNGVVKVV